MSDSTPGWLLDALAFQARLRELDCRPSSVQFEIDGLVYSSSKWAATDGLRIWPRLVRVLGSGLIRALVTGELSKYDFVEGAVHLAEQASEVGVHMLVKEVLARMQVNRLAGTPDGGAVLTNFDAHFTGEYAHLLRVCALAIAHNLRGPTRGPHSTSGSPSPETSQRVLLE